MAGWLTAAASRRGTAHARRGEPRQDAVLVRHGPGEALVAAVADGAGSAPRGGAGAALACRVMAASAAARLRRDGFAALDPSAAVEAARAALLAAAGRHGIAPRALATTAILLLSDGERTRLAHVGDGAVVARGADGGWTALAWPAGGPYAGMTAFLTDEPAPEVRVREVDGPVSGLALFTDGLERLVLDLAGGTPHAPFFDMVAAPLDRRAADPAVPAGRDRTLSAALARYLGSEPVTDRTDDDTTLLLAVRRPPAGP